MQDGRRRRHCSVVVPRRVQGVKFATEGNEGTSSSRTKSRTRSRTERARARKQAGCGWEWVAVAIEDGGGFEGKDEQRGDARGNLELVLLCPLYLYTLLVRAQAQLVMIDWLAGSQQTDVHPTTYPRTTALAQKAPSRYNAFRSPSSRL